MKFHHQPAKILYITHFYPGMGFAHRKDESQQTAHLKTQNQKQKGGIRVYEPKISKWHTKTMIIIQNSTPRIQQVGS